MESYFARARRLVRSGVETVVGAAERATAGPLMRQAIRDVESAADDLRRRRDAAAARRVRAAEQQRAAAERLATLGEQARFALVAGREDLAQAAVEEQVGVEEVAAAAREAEAEAVADERRIDEALAQVEARRQRLQAELRTHEAAADAVARTLPSSVERKVGEAERTFERIAAAHGHAVASDVSASAARTAEIETLKRERAVADRLAALRTEIEGAAEKARAGRRR